MLADHPGPRWLGSLFVVIISFRSGELPSVSVDGLDVDLGLTVMLDSDEMGVSDLVAVKGDPDDVVVRAQLKGRRVEGRNSRLLGNVEDLDVLDMVLKKVHEHKVSESYPT